MSDSRLESAPERAFADAVVSQSLYDDAHSASFDRIPEAFVAVSRAADLPGLTIQDARGSDVPPLAGGLSVQGELALRRSAPGAMAGIFGGMANPRQDRVYAADHGNGSGAAVVAAGSLDNAGNVVKAAPEPPKPPARLTAADFEQRMDDLFNRFDADKNGYLTKEELSTQVKSSDIKGEDAQAAAALYEGVDRIQKLNDDEWFLENSGMTKEDLKKFVAQDKAFDKEWAMACGLKSWAEGDGFKLVDSNKDGWLGADEVTARLNDQTLSANERQMLEYLRDNKARLENLHDDEFGIENDGATVNDILGNFQILQKSDQGRLGAAVDGALYRTYESQIQGSKKLYASQDPLLSIRPEAIKQGSIGNCYFEATLASMAATNPAAIKDMIEDKGNGVFKVTFPGDKQHPIVVNMPTEAEQGLYNKGSETGVWASVMEKAFGEWKQQQRFSRQGYTSQEGGEGGGFAKDVFKLMTGKEADAMNPNDESESATAKRLSDAFLNGNSVTCATSVRRYETFFGATDHTKDNFIKSHEYSVIAFDPKGPDGGTVTIRNPWGGTDGTTSGKIAISVKQFRENFNDMTVSNK